MGICKGRSVKKGFTILEVLVASLLVGLGIFAIMEAFNRGYLGVGQVEDYSLALSLAQERMEEIQDTAFASVTSSTKAAVTGFSDFQREVVATSPHADLKQVVVTAYWTVPNGENNVALTSYVANGS
ncbi:MAG: hypothetical protein A3C35_03190 [Omnitrophica bacterium RIFCSPHIGHO2_02_FULL_46_11]|nr:MAG: hypothetical protein A3C35_03190 [Omnitrophica bacterium RIFCSPHIGHO2_02_FULL_46_11]OGW87537.1 MAG: hypothetical protein A3A81_03195 [Omnitrophica bacterium RIFCSPLOWO2_01_FULL_45_10b]